jgi:hypothetical protein
VTQTDTLLLLLEATLPPSCTGMHAWSHSDRICACACLRLLLPLTIRLCC